MNNVKGIFVTGTNTGVGKTVVTAALLRLARRHGASCIGLKPVASGSARAAAAAPLRNADALELQAAGSMPVPYETVNPYCFEPPIAPHLAAREAGVALDLSALVAWYRQSSRGADLVLMEGAGGWRVPLHPAGFLSDLPEALGLDVLLVVGLTLGCLNHARLTAEAIARTGRCRLTGWIANEVDPAFERVDENLETLAGLLGGPPLARVPDLRQTRRSSFGHPVHEFADESRLLDALALGAA
ncbi:MAG TPA: dethiobiotin synthase [Steroidobacteraceae bacterium]|nr:dethiobiotin synthase [Steroidobacteraceae bacterium]